MLTAFIIIATVLLIGIISYFMTGKLKKEVWEGELTDKREETVDDSLLYRLYIKTADGKDKKVYVKKSFFDQLTIGDKLIKVKGETDPRKAA